MGFNKSSLPLQFEPELHRLKAELRAEFERVLQEIDCQVERSSKEAREMLATAVERINTADGSVSRLEFDLANFKHNVADMHQDLAQ